MNKRTTWIALLAFVAFGASLLGFSAIPNAQLQHGEGNQIISLSELSHSSEGTNVSATYNDAASNFLQLEESAGYIVRASVVSTNMKSSVAQEAVLAVNVTYKGSVSDSITLYQIATDNPVEVGKEYILFLNPQWPENLDSQVYYPVGGGIGSLEIEPSTMHIYVDGERIMGDDLHTWVEENLALQTSRSAQNAYQISVREK